VFPALGTRPLNTLTRGDCRALVAACRQEGLSRKSVENISRTVSSVLSQAVEDGMLTANPAFRLGRYYRNGDAPRPEIQPFSRAEAAFFLDGARQHAPKEFPLFLCALRTGMRLGELLGLQWTDIDFHGRYIEVRRNIVAGRVTTPKNGRARRVDMSTQLTEALRALLTARKADTLGRGWGQVPEWVFCSDSGGPLDGDIYATESFISYWQRRGCGAFASTISATPTPVSCCRTAKVLPTSRSRWATRRSRSPWTSTAI